MRTDIGTMSAGLADLAPRDSVTALETAIRDLTKHIETSREEGMRETLLKPLAELADDLRQTLGNIDPHLSMDGLEREIKAVGDRLEVIGRSPPDPAALAHIQEQTQEIHRLLTAAAARPLPIEQIEKQVAALAAQIARQNVPMPIASGESFDFSAQQQTQVDSLGKIEDRLDDLVRKVEKAVTEGSLGAQQIDRESLEAVVRTLADKFADARDPQAGQAAFEALQGQITELAQRLERSDSGFSALTSLQRSIGDLFKHLEDTRFVANEAAQAAAREAVREAMQQPGMAVAGVSQPVISREIADLREVQDEADRRTHSTLNAVHETLEKIVDRLAMLEEEIGEAKQANGSRAAARRTSRHFRTLSRKRPGFEPLGFAAAQNAAGRPRHISERARTQSRAEPQRLAGFSDRTGDLVPQGQGRASRE